MQNIEMEIKINPLINMKIIAQQVITSTLTFY